MENLNALEKAKRNKANYLRAKELFNQNRIGECILFYALNHEVRSTPGEKGRAEIQRFLEGLHESWADIQITVEHAVAEDDWVMGRSVATATHSKTIMGVPPTGKKIVAVFWDLHRFDEDGLIVETWNLMDNPAIMRQLGLLS